MSCFVFAKLIAAQDRLRLFSEAENEEITKEKFIELWSAHSETADVTQAITLFDLADKNQDGKISMDEIHQILSEVEEVNEDSSSYIPTSPSSPASPAPSNNVNGKFFGYPSTPSSSNRRLFVRNKYGSMVLPESALLSVQETTAKTTPHTANGIQYEALIWNTHLKQADSEISELRQKVEELSGALRQATSGLSEAKTQRDEATEKVDLPSFLLAFGLKSVLFCVGKIKLTTLSFLNSLRRPNKNFSQQRKMHRDQRRS
jgi:hypothetical protein